MSKFEIENKLREVRLACSAVYTVPEAMETEQMQARNMLTKVFDESIGEEIRILSTVIKMSETSGGIETGAPNLGKHTQHYLSQLGYTETEIKALAEKKVIKMT